MAGTPSPEKNRRGVLEVQIYPVHATDLSRWGRFRSWLKRVLGDEIDKAGAEAAGEYVQAAKAAGLEKLRETAVRNAKVEAEISQALTEALQKQVEAQRMMLSFESDQGLLKAQAEKVVAEAEKLNAEAFAIRLDAKVRVLQQLRALGIDATPIVEDGEMTGLFLSARSATPELTVVEASQDDDDEDEP